MKLFGKKRETKKPCGCTGWQGAGRSDGPAKVVVLGSGCAKCSSLEAAAAAALTELGLDPAVGHVTDPAQIASYGVMMTPALVLNGRVVSSGRVLKKEEIKSILQAAESGISSGA